MPEVVAGRDSQTVENVESLMCNEEIVKSALNKIPPLLDVSRPFGGEELLTAYRDEHRAIGSA